MTNFLIRLDDIHPNMNYNRLLKFCSILDKYNIKPIIGVIPNNKDESLNAGEYIENFFLKIKELQEKGYIVAMHGHEHKYSKKESGIMGINKYSEFAGLAYEEQNYKISKGLEILNFHGIKTNMFMAPAHSFDKNTVKALVANGISMLTDGFYLYPSFKDGIWYIPQQFWKYRNIKIDGVFTFCFHLDTLSSQQFDYFCSLSEEFFSINIDKFINIYELDLHKYKKVKYRVLGNLFKYIYSFLYKIKHSIK